MYYVYIIYSLLFLVSFAVAEQGILNENAYVKQFAFGIVFIVALAISLIQSSKEGKTAVLRITGGDMIAVTLLFVYLCFYWGTYNNLDFALPFIFFLFYVFARIYHAGNSKYISALYTIAPIIILLHVLICGLQLLHIVPAFHSYFPVGSTFGNPDVLGAYLAVLLPFCYTQPKQRIFNYSVLLLGVILLLALQARTALVATVITGILYLLLSGKITGKQLVRWLLFPFIASVALLIWWHSASVSGRLLIWFTASKMMIKKPMGWGLYAFEKHYPEFQSDYVASHRIPDLFSPDLVHSPYNEFLNTGVTLGFAGLLLFIVLALFIIIAAYKTQSPLLYPICAFLIISLAYHPSKIIPLIIILILFIAIILNSDRIKPILTINIRHKAIVLIPVMVITVLFVGNCGLSYNRWQTALENMKNEAYWKVANAQFVQAYPMMKGNGRFLVTWADLQYRMGNTSGSLSLLKEAEQYFCDDILLKNMATLYEETEQIEEAKRAFDRAVNVVPSAFNIAYERILFLQRIGEHQEAYREAIKLNNIPIKSSYYVDPFIVKSKLRTIIRSYQEEQIK
ncbi:MAG: hypothetical protein LLF80_01510 [Porphyromonadaceae bacterium]|nr:hypothetical protein [Porphyromonadaceae bacterium]